MTDELNIVTINGKEYDYVELEPQEQYKVQQIKNLTSSINKVRVKLDQLVMAKKGFTNELILSVESEKETDEG